MKKQINEKKYADLDNEFCKTKVNIIKPYIICQKSWLYKLRLKHEIKISSFVAGSAGQQIIFFTF